MQQIRNIGDIRRGLEILSGKDARLGAIIERAGDVPLRLEPPGFAGLASIVVSQQVSRASARAIYRRLSGLVIPLDAATLLAAGDDVLRLAGLSMAKQRTLKAAAHAVEEGALDLLGICEVEAEDAMARLKAVKGIGPWTAEIYLMFCAGHCDIFPAGDLALQEAAKSACGLEARPHEKQLREIALAWSPWRSVAARLLWAFYRESRAGRDGMPF